MATKRRIRYRSTAHGTVIQENRDPAQQKPKPRWLRVGSRVLCSGEADTKFRVAEIKDGLAFLYYSGGGRSAHGWESFSKLHQVKPKKKRIVLGVGYPWFDRNGTGARMGHNEVALYEFQNGAGPRICFNTGDAGAYKKYRLVLEEV